MSSPSRAKPLVIPEAAKNPLSSQKPRSGDGDLRRPRIRNPYPSSCRSIPRFPSLRSGNDILYIILIPNIIDLEINFLIFLCDFLHGPAWLIF